MKSEAMWDQLAGNWDQPGVSLGENDLRLIEKTRKYLAASAVILDYGCATGSIALELAPTVKTVYGLDLSARMIELARRKADERQAANTNFMHATIFDERLEAASLDAILAFSVLHLTEAPAQVLARINHLLKPGGVFISATPCLGEKNLTSRLINVPLMLLSKIGILPPINFFSGSQLAAAITAASFRLIETETLSGPPTSECFFVARKI
ncbi:MAG TPA: class I SAM-dependent methyltransferase [Phototrophicaceae bacterium]|nr:class I SAM-dependent methyltransferase [Phototrophicaceae bacterium]